MDCGLPELIKKFKKKNLLIDLCKNNDRVEILKPVFLNDINDT